MTWTHRAAVAAAIVVLYGCDSTAPADAGTDAGGGDDAAIADAGSDAGGGDAAVGCDVGNDTLETAGDAMLGSAGGVVDAIACPGDVDYFAFDGVEGEVVRLYVRPMRTTTGAPVDPVLTLFDATGTQIAENDDGIEGIGRIGTHPLIVTRLPATGRYAVRVDEFLHWSGMADPVGDPSLGYTLFAVRVDADSVDAVLDPETGDDVASATPLKFLARDLGTGPVQFGYAVGTLEDATDVDVFSFEVAGSSDPVVVGATVQLPGPDASGPTTRPGHLWVTDATGAEVIARTDTSEASGLQRVSPSLPAGRYLLWVDRAAEPSEGEAFYALAVTHGFQENPREADDPGNGTLAGAETLSFMGTDQARVAVALLTFTPGDVDYLSFTLPVGADLTSLGCSGAWDGSGVRGLQAELRDESDAVLAAASEPDALPDQLSLEMDDFGVLATGTYYVRVTTDGQDPEITGAWARCAVYISMAP